MNVSPVIGGLTGQGFVLGGFVSPGAGSGIVSYADPRQGTILAADTDPAGVDPRQGTIAPADTGLSGVDPRQGSIIQ